MGVDTRISRTRSRARLTSLLDDDLQVGQAGHQQGVEPALLPVATGFLCACTRIR
jgi:hypothetical protein